MKKLFIYIAALALVTACNKAESPVTSPDSSDIVYATIEYAVDTRTALDGEKVVWNSGDEIVVFKGKTLPLKYIVSASSVGTTEGYFKKDADYELIGPSSEIFQNVAFYPFAELSCKAEGQKYTLENITLPSSQTYAADSFGPNSFPMMAVSADADDVDFRFKNLCGVLKLQLQGEGSIKSITIKGNSGETLAGSASVRMSHDTEPFISFASDGLKEVTLDCSEGVSLKADTPASFLIALPPTVFTKGFTVTVTDTFGGTKEFTTTKENTVIRSSILRMPVKEYIGARPPQEGDYFDEYGINHGQGVEIDGVVWAPVNCGYHKTNFKYGKLYQWGRKYGQGYSGDLSDGDWNYLGEYSDSEVPSVVSGPVSVSSGESASNSGKFYIGAWDWCIGQDDELWNSGTQSNPVKTKYDPCPDGWRVPTYAELSELSNNYSVWTTDENGQSGRWFSGTNQYTEAAPQVFIPAAGYRDDMGTACLRGGIGIYWSSRPYDTMADYLDFGSGIVCLIPDSRASGCSVRCVRDAPKLIPVASLTLNTSSLMMHPGTGRYIYASIEPSNAYPQSVYWSSSNTSVATVDMSGAVTAVSPGTATITAMAGMKTATCDVTVGYPDLDGTRELTLWRSEVLVNDWIGCEYFSDGGIELLAAGAQPGDFVCFYVEPIEEYWEMQIFEGHWAQKYLLVRSEEYSLTENGGKILFPLTREILDTAYMQQFWGGTFVLLGDNLIIKKATLLTYSPGL